jgi:hypothetical protein
VKRLIISILLILLTQGLAWGAEITVPYLKAKQGELVEIPVLIDKAENLAGIKLVITYDKGLLAFKEGNASKSTRSLMCVINDKNPGRLIVVMAGAKGINGKDVPLVLLTFGVKKDLPGAHSTRLEITENQLMSDQLVEIKGKVTIKPLDIVP